MPPEYLMSMVGRKAKMQIPLSDRIDHKINSVFSDWMQRKLHYPDQPSSMNLRATVPTEDDIFFNNSFDMNRQGLKQSTNKKHEICYSPSPSPSLLVSETSSEEGDYF